MSTIDNFVERNPHVLQALLPVPEIYQTDAELTANVDLAFNSAYGALLDENNSAAAQSEDASIEQSYCDLDRLEGWKCFADELTPLLVQVVRFAKAVTGFAVLTLTERMDLMKENSFELAAIALLQFYNIRSQSLVLKRKVIPIHKFQASDPAEMKFIISMHKCLHEFSKLQLTKTEQALVSAWILWERSPYETDIIDQIKDCLQDCFASRPQSFDVASMMDTLTELIARLRLLAEDHKHLLARLASQYPQVPVIDNMPALYKEIFTGAP